MSITRELVVMTEPQVPTTHSINTLAKPPGDPQCPAEPEKPCPETQSQVRGGEGVGWVDCMFSLQQLYTCGFKLSFT